MPPRKIEPANVGNVIGKNGPELIVSASVALIAMKRDPEFYDAPHTASVHPDEVKNYQAAGWVPADVKE